ncbi:SpaA isopeptide-forming pilin-related protein [Enterococcus faecalis]|uniref:SpaA isopeptide-forming pilin-related protein n=1 Tax=Enterococcus faecalis TaxID=1351 RepID=UPI00325BB2B9
MNKITRKVTTLYSLLTIVVAFFITPAVAIAATVTDQPIANYTTTWYLSRFNGLHWTDNSVWMKKVDGVPAFCIEHGVTLSHGSGFEPSELTGSEKDRLSLISYYGYQVNPTNDNYVITQHMIWEELGDQLLTSNVPNYGRRKAEILAQVAKHTAKPSFNNQTVELNVGDSITLTDQTGVLSNYQNLIENSVNLQINKNGNQLKLTATANSKEKGKVKYSIASNKDIGQSFVYTKGEEQKIAVFKLADGGTFELNIKVNLNGSVKVKKIDEETGKPLPNTKLKFEYNGLSKEFLTDSKGIAEVKEIKAGTTVKITEVTAPNGYVNKGEIKTVKIEPNKNIEVILNNKEQLGEVVLSKIGREFGTTMFNQYYSLNGAIYGVYSIDGKKIGTMMTDQKGIARFGNLKLGKYYVQEEKAPEGYLLNPEKIPFELIYAGQTVEVTTTSITHEEEEQKGTAELFKEDEKTGTKPQGAAKLDGAVYELRRKSTDEVVETITIEKGRGQATNLYLDDYYWIETKAPEGYQLDTEKHFFTLSYAGENVQTAVHQTTVIERVITGSFDLLKFGNYDWQKNLRNSFSKTKKIKPLEKVEFSVFSDATGKLVQKGLTDKEGYLQFKNLPYNTYTVKETKTPEGYQPIEAFKVTIKEQNETHHYALENKVIEEKLKVVKVDAETDKTIPRSGAGFQIKNLQTGKLMTMSKPNEEGKTDTFYTNEKGYLLTSQALAYGEYELTEVQAPEGYILANDPVKFKVDGTHEGIIEIRFKDYSQKGIAVLTKTGQTPVDITESESDYGILHEFVYDYSPISDVTYRIEAAKDIVTNDGTIRVKKGETVANVITDEKGTWHSPELYLGKYQAIEETAPNGFVIDKNPIPFELKYAGQEVELTSSVLVATNEFQSLAIQLFKNEENIEDWKNNLPVIESIQGEKKVFGLFTREPQTLSEELIVPENALVAYQTVKKGIAFFDLKLPQGKYYLKELEAGEGHQLNETEYNLEFTAENNHVTFPIHVYQDRVLYGKETLKKIKYDPIVNQLYFNQFTLKKLNEEAVLTDKEGYEFTYEETAKGAIFSLEDEKGLMLQEVIVNEDSLAFFKNIPVGTFYLKEKQTSSDEYVLSKEVYRIESKKTGVQIFNEQNELLAEQTNTMNSGEATLLFEVKNQRVKGTAELVKKDSSSEEVLTNAGIRILDTNKNTVVEGRTDEKGIFSFEQLPKGTYFFQEFDTPQGYELDETPLKFEIKEDGDLVKVEMMNKKIEVPTVDLPKTGTKNYPILVLFGSVLLIGTTLVYLKKKNKL